jgi:bacillopeptidase F (M6 metalloprotease family)
MRARLFSWIVTAVAATVPVSAAAAVDSEARALVDKLANFQFDQLGHPQIQGDSINPVVAPVQRPHKLLVLPVRFADKGYDRFDGDPAQDDKNRRYFQDLLFAGGAPNPEPATLSHYYRHQSRGLYNISGDIFPVVQLERPLHFYGRPVQSSDGAWRNDENAAQLVVDALRAAVSAHPDFPWADYDRWDPQDFDGDGNRDEPDGYLDHFILIVAGKGQASCQGLYKLDEKLSVNAAPDAFTGLTANEQACADRIWPHRFSLAQNLGLGPVVDGASNARGGVDIGNGMWVLDYNMQSEYTDVATFIHEFGHSLGLPDIYAAQTSNSTGSWEAMSGTLSPEPQELSTWSRMVLGWMQPCVVRPDGLGGGPAGSLHLKVMNDWSGKAGSRSTQQNQPCDAAMVILPPKFRSIELGPLRGEHGRQVAYSGQGNNMQRSLSRQFDLGAAPTGVPLMLEFDTWFEIEAEWDYLYVEVAGADGKFGRMMPVDKDVMADNLSVMPSVKGHEGKGSVPGFTGRSGDLDGDGKVELAGGCDPSRQRTLAEDRVGDTLADPCEQAHWVHAAFDLAPWRGQQITVRFTYFTDMAAVEDGALLDNIRIAGLGYHEDFEGDDFGDWQARGFTLSGGSHRLAVPHFYLLEYRDPAATFSSVKNYDAALAEPGFLFFPDEDGSMTALNVNYRPGVVMWYYNGEYLWSQNEPADSGPGQGFLLVVDAIPQELPVPALPQQYFRQSGGWSWWQFDEPAQAYLQDAYLETVCFQRRPGYYPTDLPPAQLARCKPALREGLPPMESLRWGERPLMYGYTIINELLPGKERLARKGATSLFDLRLRDGKTRFRLYDRLLRNLHAADAPFALTPYEKGIEFFRPVAGEMRVQTRLAFPPVVEFSDARPNRYQNPKLPFGGASIPEAGFNFRLAAPSAAAPVGSVVRIDYNWR